MVLSDVISGRKPSGPITREMQEYFMLKNFPNFSLNDIRSMSARDYRVFSFLANTQNKIENQMQERELKRAKGNTVLSR